MSENLIYTKSFAPPPVDKRELLRYAGVRESTPETEALLDDCIRESWDRLSYKVCYCEYEIKYFDGEINLGFAKTTSHSLREALAGCHKILLFCATVGVDIDRLIARYSSLSPARSVILQAFGTERVEALCDELCREIGCAAEEVGQVCTKRFSPGYGDLPLDMQREIFAALDCARRIGVSLNDNLFMTPTKSVTAIIGIRNVK
ncbi:MAG: Vitamin B12 dependent methionine synthase activation subunit [Clostridia bacterium]|nr:Vitamin B12 dependent methionine synthase activation subunit [Clostridia bacterium]